MGGDRNYDYRYAWVRDASLSLDLLSCLGKVGEVKRYLNWLCGLKSGTAAPLQVCYRLDGNTKLKQEKIPDVLKLREQPPGSPGEPCRQASNWRNPGILADCTRTYLDHDGEWRDEFWQLLKRCADHTAKNWQSKDAGIWELPEEAHHVTSRVMCWVNSGPGHSYRRKDGTSGEDGSLARGRQRRPRRSHGQGLVRGEKLLPPAV